MKKVIGLLLAIILTFSLVACANGSKTEQPGITDGSEPAVGTPSTDDKGKSIVIAVNAEIISLDPHNISDTLSSSAANTMYEGLLEHNMDMEIVPILAEGYEVSDDGLEYTFHIKEGISFHDGTPLNAEAVKYNYDRVIDPDKGLRRRGNFLHLLSTDVIDEYTVKFTLDLPYAPMLDRVASLLIISPDALEKHGDQGIITNPVGTGAYVYDKWVPGEGITVKRNDNYWREGPQIETLTMRPVAENGARIAMLQTGEADFIYPMPTEQINAINKDSNIEVIEGSSTIARFAFINMSKEMFSNVKVRQAMNHAIDKTAYAKIVKSGYAVPLTSHVAATINYHSAQPEYKYDLVKAKELLAEAGYPDGFDTTIWAPNDTENMRGMEFISQQLAEIGINVEVVPMEEGTLSDSIYLAQTPEESTVNMWYVSWSTYDFDGGTNRLFHSTNIPPTSPNVSYYMSPIADDLIDRGGSRS